MFYNEGFYFIYFCGHKTDGMKKVLLGMSGGIDSTVAAIMLKQQGYEVIGATLRLWSQDDDIHNSEIPNYITEAQLMASEIDIQHITEDVRSEFYNSVITYFKGEYLAGRTPNPCAKCNVVLKWSTLNRLARQFNCDFIATGHYVDKVYKNDNWYIRKGVDMDKEQSFFLWGLNQSLLKKAVFPLGNLTKQKVREVALQQGFKSLNSKKESTGVCFIKDNNYQNFLEKSFLNTGILPGKGNFVDSEGHFLGEHNGYPFYTVGQRRGLGLVPQEPYYVTKIVPENNTVILGNRGDLYQNEMIVSDYNIINRKDFKGEVITRVRYRKQSALSKIHFMDDNTLKVMFIKPEWSIAPGQTAAFYEDDRLLGGGFIVR